MVNKNRSALGRGLGNLIPGLKHQVLIQVHQLIVLKKILIYEA